MPEPPPVPSASPPTRPVQVIWSVVLLSAAIVLSIWYAYVTTVAYVGELLSPTIWAVIIGVTVAVGAFQLQQVYVGRNYMRVLTAIGTVLSALSLIGVTDPAYWLMNGLLVVGTALLFVPSVNAWYADVKAASAKRRQT